MCQIWENCCFVENNQLSDAPQWFNWWFLTLPQMLWWDFCAQDDVTSCIKQTTLNSERSRGKKQPLLIERDELNMKIWAQERSQSFTSSSASSEILPSQKEGWTVFSSVSSRVVPNKDLRRVGCMLHHQLCTFVLINAARIQLPQRKRHLQIAQRCDFTSYFSKFN